MTSPQDSTPASSDSPLPPGFKTIEQIQRSPNGDISAGVKVSVMGFLQDFREPIQTRGNDCKCTLTLKDKSIQYERAGLEVIIFWPIKHMPEVSTPGDVVLIRNAKLQIYGGRVSLIANKSFTQFHILAASDVPQDLADATKVQWKTYGPPQGKSVLPNLTEMNYVMWANAHKEDIELPTDHEFQDKVAKSTNFKDKFSLLKDVESDRFYNILGQLIRVFDANANGLTVYLSDYTPHTKFFNYEWEATSAVADDECGYGGKKSEKKTEDKWPGPFGKMSIQLTLFDEHAEFVREQVKVGQWVLLKNLQIKPGKMGGCLEGFLRGDNGKINVDVMEVSGDQDKNDTRLVEAVQRKFNHEKKFKKQVQDIKDEEAGLGDKRKRDGEDEGGKGNSKKRRKEKRAAAQRKEAEMDAKAMGNLDLNENLKCAHPDQPIRSFAQILQPEKITIDEGQDCSSPFTCRKYRANVRVIDYFPNRIEDFAVGYRASEYEMLSDYSGGEDTDHEEDLRQFRNGKGFAKNTWEWRFALKVEDASVKEPKETDRLWLLVDNMAAQGLLGLEEDATSLRSDKNLLQKLKRQLDILWGDLAEQKSAKGAAEGFTETPQSTFDSTASSTGPTHRAGDQPDADDSDMENDLIHTKPSKRNGSQETALQERDPNTTDLAAKSNTEGRIVPNNKPFTCCIKQYGVKENEEDPLKADAGDGQRWQRVFGLFGTSIA